MISEALGLPARGLLPAWRRNVRRAWAASAAAVLAGLGLAAGPVGAQYTAQFLPPPSAGQPPGAFAPYALNNKGQVFGRNWWGGPPPDRGPVLWNGTQTIALMPPAGYHWYDGMGLLNDIGVAVSTVQLDAATAGVRPVIWHDGAATVVPVPLALADCASRFNNLPPPYTQELFNVWPVGLNRAGQVLILACNTLWIVDSSGAVVAAGPPPVDTPPIGLQPVYFVELYSRGNHLNDAGVASVQTGVPGITDRPGIVGNGLSSYFALPMDLGYAQGINSHDQELAFVQDPRRWRCRRRWRRHAPIRGCASSR